MSNQYRHIRLNWGEFKESLLTENSPDTITELFSTSQKNETAEIFILMQPTTWSLSKGSARRIHSSSSGKRNHQNAIASESTSTTAARPTPN